MDDVLTYPNYMIGENAPVIQETEGLVDAVNGGGEGAVDEDEFKDCEDEEEKKQE